MVAVVPAESAAFWSALSSCARSALSMRTIVWKRTCDALLSPLVSSSFRASSRTGSCSTAHAAIFSLSLPCPSNIARSASEASQNGQHTSPRSWFVLSFLAFAPTFVKVPILRGSTASCEVALELRASISGEIMLTRVVVDELAPFSSPSISNKSFSKSSQSGSSDAGAAAFGTDAGFPPAQPMLRILGQQQRKRWAASRSQEHDL